MSGKVLDMILGAVIDSFMDYLENRYGEPKEKDGYYIFNANDSKIEVAIEYDTADKIILFKDKHGELDFELVRKGDNLLVIENTHTGQKIGEIDIRKPAVVFDFFAITSIDIYILMRLFDEYFSYYLNC